MTKVQQGFKPKQRKLATTVRPEAKTQKLQANQWQNTPQQNLFMQYWLDSDSPTFANAYQSALKAGYTENYAAVITSKAQGVEWISEYHRRSIMGIEHLESKLFKLITGVPNSKSPDDTVIKAIELYAKITGKLDTKNTTNINIVQPILQGSSVKTKVIEA